MSKDGKISFFLERSESGRFKARAPGFEEAQGATLGELRMSITNVVRGQLGQERPFAIMVGGAGIVASSQAWALRPAAPAVPNRD